MLSFRRFSWFSAGFRWVSAAASWFSWFSGFRRFVGLVGLVLRLVGLVLRRARACEQAAQVSVFGTFVLVKQVNSVQAPPTLFGSQGSDCHVSS